MEWFRDRDDGFHHYYSTLRWRVKASDGDIGKIRESNILPFNFGWLINYGFKLDTHGRSIASKCVVHSQKLIMSVNSSGQILAWCHPTDFPGNVPTAARHLTIRRSAEEGIMPPCIIQVITFRLIVYHAMLSKATRDYLCAC